MKAPKYILVEGPNRSLWDMIHQKTSPPTALPYKAMTIAWDPVLLLLRSARLAVKKNGTYDWSLVASDATYRVTVKRSSEQKRNRPRVTRPPGDRGQH